MPRLLINLRRRYLEDTTTFPPPHDKNRVQQPESPGQGPALLHRGGSRPGNPRGWEAAEGSTPPTEGTGEEALEAAGPLAWVAGRSVTHGVLRCVARDQSTKVWSEMEITGEGVSGGEKDTSSTHIGGQSELLSMNWAPSDGHVCQTTNV